MTEPTWTLEWSPTTNPADAPVWVGISSYARGIQFHRGRQNELDRFEAGTGTLVLDNADRTFDPWDNSNVLPLRRFRLTLVWAGKTYYVFNAFSEQWPPSWPGGGTDALVQVRLVDGFKALALHKLSSSYSQEASHTRIGNVLDDVGWPSADRNLRTGQSTMQASTLGKTIALQHLQDVEKSENGKLFIDGQGRITFWDRHAPWQMRSQLFSQATFGDDDSVPAATVSDTATRANNSSSPGSAETGQAWTVHTGTWGVIDNQLYPVTQDDGEHMSLDTTLVDGEFGVDITVSNWANFEAILTFRSADTSNRLAVWMYDGTLGLKKVVGGSGTTLASTAVAMTNGSTYTLLVRAQQSTVTVSLNGTVHLCYVLTDAEANTFCVSTATRLGLQQWVYSASGTVRFDNVVARAPKELGYRDLRPSFDDSQIWNDISVTRTGGTEQTASDATSIARYYQRSLVMTNLLITSDSEASDAANYRLARNKDPWKRFDAIILDPQLDPDNLWPQVLGREIGDKITVKRRPLGGGTISQDSWVEAIGFTYNGNHWQWTWGLTPSDVVTYWKLNDATYGLLNSTARLAY